MVAPVTKSGYKLWFTIDGLVEIATSRLGLASGRTWVGIEPNPEEEPPLTADEAEKVRLIIADRCTCGECGHENEWITIPNAALALRIAFNKEQVGKEYIPDWDTLDERSKGENLVLLMFARSVSDALRRIRGRSIAVKTLPPAKEAA